MHLLLWRHARGNIRDFSAVDEVEGQPVNAVFHKDDIPDYQSCAMHDCPLCKEGRRIDALVNSFGYSKL